MSYQLVINFSSVPRSNNFASLLFEKQYSLIYEVVVSCFLSCNHGHNIFRLFYILPNFLSPQVKRTVIISNKDGIYELPNDLRRRTLGK